MWVLIDKWQAPMSESTALFESNLSQLELLNRGKVRDIYAVDDDHMLIVTSDRLSAFDVVMSQPIPGKGEVLTRVANFWFKRTRELIPNHLAELPLEDVVPDTGERALLGDRALVVKRLNPLPVEAIRLEGLSTDRRGLRNRTARGPAHGR